MWSVNCWVNSSSSRNWPSASFWNAIFVYYVLCNNASAASLIYCMSSLFFCARDASFFLICTILVSIAYVLRFFFAFNANLSFISSTFSFKLSFLSISFSVFNIFLNKLFCDSTNLNIFYFKNYYETIEFNTCLLTIFLSKRNYTFFWKCFEAFEKS